jgi:AraC-like DNA-binding protein
MQYIRRERVEMAKELLLFGYNVNEAATKLGFKTPFHLSRIFSQIEGKSPIYFRKLARRGLTAIFNEKVKKGKGK